MNRKTFLGSLFSFGFMAQTPEVKKEKSYRNGECPVCDTPVTEWLNEPKCDSAQSKEVIKPAPQRFCATNEVTGSFAFQHHVCQKCKTIFAYLPTKTNRRR